MLMINWKTAVRSEDIDKEQLKITNCKLQRAKRKLKVTSYDQALWIT